VRVVVFVSVSRGSRARALVRWRLSFNLAAAFDSSSFQNVPKSFAAGGGVLVWCLRIRAEDEPELSLHG